MNSIILIGILIFVALIILGIYTGEREQARVLLESLNEEEQENKEDLDETIEGFGPSVANLGDISSGSSTLYNWGNSDINNSSSNTSQEENCGTSSENTLLQKENLGTSAGNTSTVVNNYIKNNCPSNCPDNQKTCWNCDITLNKDIDKYVLKSSVPPCPDMSKYASKKWVFILRTE